MCETVILQGKNESWIKFNFIQSWLLCKRTEISKPTSFFSLINKMFKMFLPASSEWNFVIRIGFFFSLSLSSFYLNSDANRWMLVCSDRSLFTPFAPFVFDLLAQLRQSKYIHASRVFTRMNKTFKIRKICKIREKSMGLERHQYGKRYTCETQSERKKSYFAMGCHFTILPFLAIATLYYSVQCTLND